MGKISRIIVSLYVSLLLWNFIFAESALYSTQIVGASRRILGMMMFYFFYLYDHRFVIITILTKICLIKLTLIAIHVIVSLSMMFLLLAWC